MVRFRRLIPASLATALAAAVLLPGPAAHAAPPPPERAFTLPGGLAEISGMAMSLRHPGIVYAHNDSGNASEIFAVDTATGRLAAKLTVTNAPNTDWEALAVANDEQGRPSVYIGDIGNNFGGRDPNVYRLPEPGALADASVTATQFRLRFADGPHDAESMLVDPGSGRLYVASKIFAAPGKLYQAPLPLDPGAVNTLSDTGRPAPAYATGGAFAPDGASYTLRSGGPFGENAAWLYDSAGTQTAKVALPSQGQGEAITYYDGTSVLVASENDAQVWRVHLPSEKTPPGGTLTVTAPGDQRSTFNGPVNVRVRAEGGDGPLTFRAGGLPFGLSIDSSGTITGRAWQVGAFPVTVTVTDRAGHSAAAAFSWTVSWF